MGIPNPQVLNDLIFQIGMVVYSLGLKLLRNVSEFEFFIQLYVPKQDLSGEAHILDIGYSKFSIRTALLFDKNFKLYFIIQDSEGILLKIRINRYVSFDKLYMINVCYVFTDELKTNIKIHMNYEKVNDDLFDLVLSFRNDFNFFKVYQNRSFENVNQGMTIGIGQYILTSSLSPLEKGKMAFYLKKPSTKQAKFLWYSRGTYGYTEPPKNDRKMHGIVNLLTIDDYLRNKADGGS